MKNKSDILKIEAIKIVEDLALLEILNNYGDAHIVGSVALNLIVKPDIDIHLYAKKNDLFEVVDPIYRTLLGKSQIKHIRLSDYREKGGIKIGIDSFPGPTESWSMGMWVTNQIKTTGFALIERLNKQLTDDSRKIILEIKESLNNSGDLKNGISTKIYTAVVDYGIRCHDEFQKMKNNLTNGCTRPSQNFIN